MTGPAPSGYTSQHIAGPETAWALVHPATVATTRNVYVVPRTTDTSRCVVVRPATTRGVWAVEPT